MDEVRLKNFRCLRDRQTARLAPLTLLVGGNSTGKTSFLALIRALWDAAYAQAIPDFKEPPSISAASTKSSTTVREGSPAARPSRRA